MSNWQLQANRIILPIATGLAFLTLIFVILLLINPEWTSHLPLLRESVAALAAVAMVVATLFLAWATFSLISTEREREKRGNEESLLNKVIECGLPPLAVPLVKS